MLLNLPVANKYNFIHVLKFRQRKDKEGLVKMSSDVTDQLLSISRHLADTTQRSADTLETLGMAVFQFVYYIYMSLQSCCYILSGMFFFLLLRLP